MSAVVVISECPSVSAPSFWVGSGTLFDICEYLSDASKGGAVLNHDKLFQSVLDQSHGDVLCLHKCSEGALTEVARLLIDGASADHVFWRSKAGASSTSGTREAFMRLALAIMEVLKEKQAQRDAMSPHQRLCSLLSFRARELMPGFLADHGLKPDDLSSIKARVDRGEWPRSILEFVPVPSWKKFIIRQMLNEVER